jgi:hypothetical protein
MSFSIDWTIGLSNASETLRMGAKEFSNLAKSEKDKDKQFLYRRLSGLCSFMSSLFLLGLNNRRDIDVLFQAFDNMPNDEKYDKLRAELEKVKSNDNEVTIKVNKELENELREWLKERQRAKKAQSEYVK